MKVIVKYYIIYVIFFVRKRYSMKVCLISPKPNMKSKDSSSSYSNLGIGYIASLLKDHKHEVYLYDGNVQEFSKDDWIEFLTNSVYEVFGISVYEYNYFDAIAILNQIRKYQSSSFVFFGGYYSTFYYNSILSKLDIVNCCVLGEGEITCCELINHLSANSDWHTLKGIAFRNAIGEVVCTGLSNVINHLDDIPFPTRVVPAAFLEKISMISSRGCYEDCIICSVPYFRTNKQIRLRSPQNIVDELLFLKRKYNSITRFDFMDNNLLLGIPEKKEWIDEFIGLLKKIEFSIQFSVFARPVDVCFHKNKLQELQAVGLNMVFLECHSFMDRQLEFLCKNTTVEANNLAIFALEECGINYSIQLSLFEPTTFLEELRMQLDCLASIFVNQSLDNNQLPLSFHKRIYPLCKSMFNDYYVKQNLSRHNYYQDTQMYSLEVILLEWQTMVNKIYIGTIKQRQFLLADLDFVIDTCDKLPELCNSEAITIHLDYWYQHILMCCS